MLRSSDFERIYRDGKKLTSPSFAIFTLPNPEGRSRLGMTVTRKFGNSVLRNRYKRIVREIFRRNRASFGAGDYVVNIRTRAGGKTHAELSRELLGCVTGKGLGVARP